MHVSELSLALNRLNRLDATEANSVLKLEANVLPMDIWLRHFWTPFGLNYKFVFGVGNVQLLN